VAIYAIAGLLVVLFLFGAYRMMGAGASTDEDPRSVLMAVLETTAQAARALEGTPAASDDENGPRAVRRRLDGCAQALERIAAIPVDVALDQARSALELAVDELGWSARMAEAPGYARDESLRDAGTALRTRGAANVARARSLLEASAPS
jgi:hypothetical protein